MTPATFAGLVTGQAIGLSLVAVSAYKARRSGAVEDDERSQLIRAQTGAAAFWATGIFAWVGSMADGLFDYLQGTEIQLLTPWSFMVVFMAMAYGVVRLYQQASHSVDGDADHDPATLRKRRLSALLFLIAAAALLLAALLHLRDGDLQHAAITALTAVALLVAAGFQFLRSR